MKKKVQPRSFKTVLLLCSLLLSLISFSCAPWRQEYRADFDHQTYSGETSGEIDGTFETIWQAALFVISARADMTDQNILTGYIHAESSGRVIIFRLRQITQHRGYLRVQAYDRRTGKPDNGLSDEIYLAIARAMPL